MSPRSPGRGGKGASPDPDPRYSCGWHYRKNKFNKERRQFERMSSFETQAAGLARPRSSPGPHLSIALIRAPKAPLRSPPCPLLPVALITINWTKYKSTEILERSQHSRKKGTSGSQQEAKTQGVAGHGSPGHTWRLQGSPKTATWQVEPLNRSVLITSRVIKFPEMPHS
ncbi:uncharacterized protein AAG666_013829 isoform 2-T3 [Megaptera novaeangliae]